MQFFESKRWDLIRGLFLLGIGIYELIVSISLLPGTRHIVGLFIWSFAIISGVCDLISFIKHPKKED